MKNPTFETLELALSLHQEGTKMKDILAETGLNYSQAWYYIRSAEVREAGLLEPEFTMERVAELRGVELKSGVWVRTEGERLSWGEIAVRFQKPESQVRSAFTKHTELRSQGNRIGKGGRKFYGPVTGEPLYNEGLRPTGTLIPKGAHVEDAYASADTQKLVFKDITVLRSEAEAAGVSAKGTKAQLMIRLAKHRASVTA